MTFSLLIFSLNELEGLKVILPRIKREWVDEILVIDGGSTDGSIEFTESLGFRVMVQKGKGFVAGLKEGLEAITGDVVITFTPDNNMIPEKIPELVAKMKEGYDTVIVSRYLDEARSEDDHFISGFGNWLFTFLVNICFKADFTDCLGFYRAYRKDLFRELGLDYPSWGTQFCIRCVRKKVKWTEIPGDEPSRIGGNSIRRIWAHGFVELMCIVHELMDEHIIRRR